MAGPVGTGHAIGALVVGVLEIVFGLIIMICSFVLGSKIKASASLTPYWAGIPYMVPGILGIVVGATKNSCAMIAFMVLNIICFVLMGISSILIIIVVGIYAAVATEITKNCTYYSSLNTCSCYNKGIRYNYKVDSCSVLSSIVALLYAVVIFCAFSAIAALAGSIIACAATCCSGGNNQPGTVIVQQPVIMQGQQPYGQQAQPGYGQQPQPGYVQQPPNYAEKA